MTLREAILTIQPDPNWGIYCVEPFNLESEAKIATRQFPNGGFPPSYRYFCSGLFVSDSWITWTRDEEFREIASRYDDEFAQYVLEYALSD